MSKRDYDLLDAELHGQGVAERAQVIAARRQHIRDIAKCVSCGAPRLTCDRARQERRDPTAPPWFGCCARGILLDQPCHHREDSGALKALLDEITAGGHVRTVAEVDPPPRLGPAAVSMPWLLGQDVWWYPNRRPAVRIANMDKPWRYNTVRFLERRAILLADDEHWRMVSIRSGPFGPGGDMACDAFDREMDGITEDPLGWLHSRPLLRKLRDGLPPTASRKGLALALRAKHWNTCPRRKAHPGRQACTCIITDGRTVGATNDPAKVTT